MHRGALVTLLRCALQLTASASPNNYENMGEELDKMPWVITKDQGTWPHDDIAIPDLQAFLQVAQLEEHLETLESEHGLHLDDVQEVTDEQLERLGVPKLMHRRRFLRYAKEMHVQEPVDPAEEQDKARFRLAAGALASPHSRRCGPVQIDAKKAKEKARYDTMLERAAQRARGEGNDSPHSFGFQCTEIGRNSGACR